ncbi:MAG: hypothetical protein ACR2PM_19480 [Hyphomicrobiales bacterium]
MLSFPTRKLLPTTDVYFYHHLRDYISSPWRGRSGARPVTALSPSVFHCGGRALIARYATRSDLRKLARLKPAQVFYLIDDDIRAALEAPELPNDYRHRLGRFAVEILPAIEDMADCIVTPSPVIASAYDDRPYELLAPGCIDICEDFSHFDDVSTVRLAFLGTRSHLSDLEFLADVLVDLCARCPGLEVMTYLGRHAPAAMQRMPGIRSEAPLPWQAYKRSVLGRQRFHLAIAPMLDTPFNRARSFNKFLDHAAVGAYGLYSRHAALDAVVSAPEHGLLLGNERDHWAGELERCVLDAGALRDHAMAAAARAGQVGAPQRIRAFWSQHLDFELEL